MLSNQIVKTLGPIAMAAMMNSLAAHAVAQEGQEDQEAQGAQGAPTLPPPSDTPPPLEEPQTDGTQADGTQADGTDTGATVPAASTSTSTTTHEPTQAEQDGLVDGNKQDDGKRRSRLGSSFLAKTEYGLRFGYGLPAGSLWADEAIGDWIGGAFELQFDLNYVLVPSLAGGIYIGIDIPSTASELDDQCESFGNDCSAFGARVGFQGEYRFAPEEALKPWIGLGLGAEVLSISEDGPRTDYTVSLVGPELSLQGGLDFGLGPIDLGVYATYRLAWFGSISESYGPFYTGQGEIRDSSIHHWLALGVRGHLMPVK